VIRLFLRKGIAAFNLEEYESARDAFRKGSKITNNTRFRTWIRKCDAEIDEESSGDDDDSGEGMKVIDLDETPPKKANQPKKTTTNVNNTPKNTTQKTQQPSFDGPPPLEPDNEEPINTNPPPRTNFNNNPPQQQNSAPPQQNFAPPPQLKKNRHEYYQNQDYVCVTIFIKNVQRENCNIQINPRELDVTILLEPGNEYHLNLSLFDEVDPQLSRYEILRTKVEINLKKKRSSHWLSLERKEDLIQAKTWNSNNPIVIDDNKPKARKNWDKVVKEIDVDKEEGGIQQTFQDIFKNADEDQRRAMEKSFYESGGTVLSTNWSEVGKGKVEISPPDGMVAKNLNSEN